MDLFLGIFEEQYKHFYFPGKEVVCGWVEFWDAVASGKSLLVPANQPNQHTH